MSKEKGALRGIIHFHTFHSFDATTRPRDIAKFAQKNALDFVVVTDHDTCAGSLDVAKEAAALGLNLECPMAAEYKTSLGDVVAIFLKEEIKAREIDAFIAEARAQGAVLLLPHPYVSHKEVDKLAGLVDGIEIFNSRNKPSSDDKARDLATRLGMRTYMASDAHFPKSLGCAIVTIPNGGGLRESLLKHDAVAENPSRCSRWELKASQFVGSYKTKGLKGVLQRFAKIVRGRVAPKSS
jgi:predicted metal-dependent phosphoesterase TrpH